MGRGAGGCLGGSPRCKRVQKEFRSILQPGCSLLLRKVQPGESSSQLCPVFYVPPGLPPPNPHLPVVPLPEHTVPDAGQRFHTEVPPKQGHLRESSGSGRPLEQCCNARKAAIEFIPPRGLCSLCLPSGYSGGGAAPAPTCPGTDLLQVFSVPSHHVRVLSSQFPISTRARDKRRKLTF